LLILLSWLLNTMTSGNPVLVLCDHIDRAKNVLQSKTTSLQI
jgi:hypothetical protein